MATKALMSAAAAGGRVWSSRSTITMGAVSGSHLLRIGGYTKSMELLDNGEHIKSAPFNVGGHRWRLKYYPKGRSSFFASDYVGLFVKPEVDPSRYGIAARVGFSFLDPDGKPVPSLSTTEKTSDFHYNGIGWGNDDVFLRDDIENSRCIKDDSLTIRCDLDVTTTKPIIEGDGDVDNGRYPAPISDLQKDLGNLLRNSKGADVVIEVGGETFPVHRWLLAARSPCLEEILFASSAKEIKKAVSRARIHNMDPRVFKSLLHFIYTDTLPKMDNGTTTAMAQGLIAAADRFNLEGLKMTCEEMLLRRIDTSTVATTLVLAEQHHCRVLKAACMGFFSCPENMKAVMATEGFDLVKTRCPGVIMELVMEHGLTEAINGTAQ